MPKYLVKTAVVYDKILTIDAANPEIAREKAEARVVEKWQGVSGAKAIEVREA